MRRHMIDARAVDGEGNFVIGLAGKHARTAPVRILLEEEGGGTT